MRSFVSVCLCSTLSLTLACSGSSSDGPADPDPTPTPAATPTPQPTRAPTVIGDLELAGEFAIPGLEGPVEVVRDEWGVPHIYASTLLDAVRVQGWVTVGDRLFQMDAMRRQPQGRLSEAFGPSTILDDISIRFFRMRQTAEAVLAAMPADDKTRQLLEAYADGVNAWLGQADSNALGAEYANLGLRVEDITPWHALDTIAFGRAMVHQLGYDGYVGKLEVRDAREALDARFPDGDPRFGITGDLLSHRPIKATSILETAHAQTRRALRPPQSRAQRLERFRALRPQLPRLAPGLLDRARARMEQLEQRGPFAFSMGRKGTVGSNNWVVAGAHSQSGFSLLANDPHLGLDNPSTFYQVHLNTTRAGGDINVVGVGFAAAPGVIVGHNDHFGWGVTTHFSDVTDWYIEEVTPGADGAKGTVLFNGAQVPIETRVERIRVAVDRSDGRSCDNPDGDELQPGEVSSWMQRILDRHPEAKVEEVNGHCEVVVEFYEVPHHGPIASFSEDGTQALSVRWSGFEPSDEIRAFVEIDQAKDLAGFQAALRNFGVGAQNFVFADTDGNIYYSAHNRVPVRRIDREHPVDMPLPGTGDYEWTGFLDDALLPRSLNPAKGYVVTANNDVGGVSADGDPFNEVIDDGSPYWGFHWSPGYRAHRITEMIEEGIAGGGKLTLEDMQTMQGDHKSNSGADFVPLLLEAVDAAAAGTAGLEAWNNERIQGAAQRLRGWGTRGYNSASGVRNEASETQQQDAIAASIYNAWLQHFHPYVLGDEFRAADVGVWSFWAIAGLYNVAFREDALLMATGADGHAILFDDLDTPDVEETRDQIALKALADALDFLATDEAFGSADQSTWMWGELHTLTLRHLSGEELLQLPNPNDAMFPRGYPRHGENWVVDASAQGLSNTSVRKRFSYGSGPAMRMVLELDPAGIRGEISIPGGQVASSFVSPFYANEIRDYWSVNRTHAMLRDEAEVVSHAHERRRMMPAP